MLFAHWECWLPVLHFENFLYVLQKFLVAHVVHRESWLYTSLVENFGYTHCVSRTFVARTERLESWLHALCTENFYCLCIENFGCMHCLLRFLAMINWVLRIFLHKNLSCVHCILRIIVAGIECWEFLLYALHIENWKILLHAACAENFYLHALSTGNFLCSEIFCTTPLEERPWSPSFGSMTSGLPPFGCLTLVIRPGEHE